MAKPELGTKRVCQSCGARFYDLGRDPAPCPKCGFENSLETLLRAKRPRVPAEAKSKPKPPDRRAVAEEDLDETLPVGEEDEEEDEDLIEDASELGEDEEDVSDVLENADDDSGNEDR